MTTFKISLTGIVSVFHKHFFQAYLLMLLLLFMAASYPFLFFLWKWPIASLVW